MYAEMRTRYQRYAAQSGFRYDAGKQRYWDSFASYASGVAPDVDGPAAASALLQRAAVGFSAGLDKVCVAAGPASADVVKAVRVLTELVPTRPTARDVTRDLGLDPSAVAVHRFTTAEGRWVYLAWAQNGRPGPQTIALPVKGDRGTVVDRHGTRQDVAAQNGSVPVTVTGGVPLSEPVFLVDSVSAR